MASVAKRAFQADEECKILQAWWRSLEQERADRAQLRRCRGPDQVLLLSAFHGLARELPGLCRREPLALATVAGLASHIEHHDSGARFAEQLGTLRGGKPVFSELRFQQLQKASDWTEFYRRLRRALAVLEHRTNLIWLARDVFQWGAEQRGAIAGKPDQRLRYRWAQQYFSAVLAAPSGRVDQGART